MTKVESIILQNVYLLPQDSAKDIAHEIVGKQSKNQIIFVLNKKEYKYDFLLDSFYKIEQLNKLIANWHQSGYPITYQP